MKVGKGRIIGIDLGNDDCQVSYFDPVQGEPQTLPSYKDNYQIPVYVGFFKERWIYGREAKRVATVSGGDLAVGGLLAHALSGERIRLGEDTYDGIWLLAKFISLALEELGEIEYITFTTPSTSIDMSKLLKGVGKYIGVPKANIYVQDYRETFCHYMVSQPKELWQYEAALFSCDGDRIESYMLKKVDRGSGVSRDRFVMVDQVADGSLREFEAISPFVEDGEIKGADEKFKALIENVFDKKIISSVYLTGKGFEDNWYPESLKVLCNGRRAFLGNNLYSKGACYHSVKKTRKVDEGPIYLDNTKMMDQICLKLRMNGSEGWYPIVSCGTCWYEADNSWEVLLEDGDDIEIMIETINEDEPRIEVVSLRGFEERKDYSMRLMIEVMFIDDRKCRLIFKDMGFGEFFPPTGFIVEKEIELGGNYGKLNSMP